MTTQKSPLPQDLPDTTRYLVGLTPVHVLQARSGPLRRGAAFVGPEG